jgi:hypothetical protein
MQRVEKAAQKSEVLERLPIQVGIFSFRIQNPSKKEVNSIKKKECCSKGVMPLD